MKTHVFSPKDTAIKSLIEFYLAVEWSEPIEVKTIPNGRVDASIALAGTLEWFFRKSNKFERLSAATFYPLTRTGGRARSPGQARCIGIKFYPHILALPAFENKKLREPLSFDELFEKSSNYKGLVADLRKTITQDHQVELLDAYFLKHFFPAAAPDSWIQRVAHAIESGSSSQTRIGELAETMGVSIKTLERRFQQTVGVTPKCFSAIIQLHQTTRSIRKNKPTISHGDLTDALGNGYYDQSHFIKSCLRITGLTPKKLFTSLPEQITDLVIVG